MSIFGCFKNLQITNIATMSNFLHVYYHIVAGESSESLSTKGIVESGVKCISMCTERNKVIKQAE